MTKKMTILIPTLNRPDFLKRTLDFYYQCSCQYKFLVGDASAGYASKLNQEICLKFPNVEYFNFSDDSVGLTIQKLNKYVNTDYVTILPDDDLIMPRAIDKIISFLDSDHNYIAANGNGAIYELDKPGAYGKIRDLGDYPQRSILGETAPLRLQALLENYFVVIFSIHRIKPWIDMWTHARNGLDIAFNDELTPSYLSAILGNTYHFDDFYLLRQTHDQRINHKKGFKIRIPLLSKIKIFFLNRKRNISLPKLRINTHPDYYYFNIFERILRGGNGNN